MPVCLLAHHVSKKEGDALKAKVSNLMFSEGKGKHKDVGAFSKQIKANGSELVVKCIGTYDKLTLEFYKNKPFTPKSSPHYKIDLNLLNKKDRKNLEAICKLNLGGFTRRAEKRGLMTQFSQFFAKKFELSDLEGQETIHTLKRDAYEIRAAKMG